MILALALALAVQEPVRVELNHDQYSAGDKARVYVRSADDGYLVVLHADPDGRVRVLFPLDPSDDDFIRAGKKFEIRGRGNRDAFQIEGAEGAGLVVAAVSPDPFKFDDFVRNDHWDFRALGGPSSSVKDDPLAKLVDIVQQMSGGDSTGRFDYDQATYVVRQYRYADYDYYGYGGYHRPYPRFGIRFGFGFPYYSAFYDPFCDPFWGCYGGWGWGYPYRYGYFYRPLYRSRSILFANFGSRLSRRPQFVFPQNRPLVTPVQVRTRTVVPVDSRSRGVGSWSRPRTASEPRIAPRARGTAAPAERQRGWSSPRGSGGGRPSSGSGRSGGGGRRH
jgi:Domain of unknown function (DUF4384)